jgi:shikimate kinase
MRKSPDTMGRRNVLNNIILIGLSGCGKTCLGNIISKEEGLNFIDLDEYVEEKNNMTIKEMFDISEKFFRDKESEAVEEASKLTNTIISTGGGVIKRKYNMDILSKSGCIIFIDRAPENIISTLDTSNRPLLKDGKEKLYNLHKERYELYKKYAHIIIDNNEDKEKTIDALKNIINTKIHKE